MEALAKKSFIIALALLLFFLQASSLAMASHHHKGKHPGKPRSWVIRLAGESGYKSFSGSSKKMVDSSMKPSGKVSDHRGEKELNAATSASSLSGRLIKADSESSPAAITSGSNEQQIKLQKSDDISLDAGAAVDPAQANSAHKVSMQSVVQPSKSTSDVESAIKGGNNQHDQLGVSEAATWEATGQKVDNRVKIKSINGSSLSSDFLNIDKLEASHMAGQKP